MIGTEDYPTVSRILRITGVTQSDLAKAMRRSQKLVSSRLTGAARPSAYFNGALEKNLRKLVNDPRVKHEAQEAISLLQSLWSAE